MNYVQSVNSCLITTNCEVLFKYELNADNQLVIKIEPVLSEIKIRVMSDVFKP